MDDDLRSRFRRDFTSEPIGRPRGRPPQSPQIPLTPQQAAPLNPLNSLSQSTVQPVVAPTQTKPLVETQIKEAVSLEPLKTKPKRRVWKKILIVLGILILLGAGGAGYWYKFRRPADPIPASIKSSVSYPLLYPSKLPPGYKIVSSSFTSSDSAVIFEADNQNSDKIAFSVQKRPATFDFSTFYSQGLGNAVPFSTDVGEAAVGTVAGKTIGSFSTDKSWMLVTSTSNNVTSSDIRLILNNIKQAN